AIEGLDAEKNKAAYRVLGSTPFCLAVLMLEVWNVSSEVSAWEQTIREKGVVRTGVGILGASLDLVIALEALAIKLAGQQSAISVARITLFTISSKKAAVFFGEALARKLTEKVTGRLLGFFFSGWILSAVNIIDAGQAWQWNDGAMYGYLMLSMGGVAGSLGTLFGAATKLLGLTALGWTALLLITVGVGLVIVMSSTPLESWLANGPFGEPHSIDRYLQDPAEAFYRLTSLLAGISISIEKNPAYEQHATFNTRADIHHAIRSADTIIRLQSRLPGLIGRLDSLSIQAECRQCRITEITNNQGVPYRAESKIGERPETPKAQRLHPDALELFFTTKISQISSTGSRRYYYKWAIRAQLILTRGREEHYFPAPGVKDSTQYSQNWATPDFEKINQPYWADEVTHGASSSD
ncbi:Transposase, partial [Pseudomonas syringae pv. coriandricola]